jgi:hypothetical protein
LIQTHFLYLKRVCVYKKQVKKYKKKLNQFYPKNQNKYMNEQQQHALDLWAQNYNVKITAVPGAGKSRVLLESCNNFTKGIIIILAYNHDLCEETKHKIIQSDLEDRVICMTFHGLATYCIMPTYDDTALFDAIEGAECGEIEVNKRIKVDGILIDEAQDFRPSFLRLLNLVLDTTDEVQYMVVGDVNQMLYTYDSEDPANIDFLTNPSSYFYSKWAWKEVVFYQTHRLTSSIATFVSNTFDTQIISAKKEQCSPVQIISMNLWKAGPVILNLIQAVDPETMTILVPKKKNNGPLKAALNYLSSRGHNIYLHGFDGADSRIKKHKICIGTWHSSKGTEKELTIVLGVSGESEKNPCFVALTRASQNLIIIQDEKNPHDGIMKAIEISDNVNVCNKTKFLLTKPPDKPAKYEFKLDSLVTYSIDNIRLSGTSRWIRDHQYIEHTVFNLTIEDDTTDIVNLPNNIHEDVSEIYAIACSMAMEYEVTGKVRFLEDIRSPHRLLKNQQDEAILSGHNSRFISPNIPIESLLGRDMIEILYVYGNGQNIAPVQWCELACMARCWNDYHHTLRQLRPFTWFDVQKFRNGCEIVRSNLSLNQVEFDVRLCAKSQKHEHLTLHARAHAVSKIDGIYFFVWGNEINHVHHIAASIKAALFPIKKAIVVNLKTNNVQTIQVLQSEKLLDRLLER